MSNEITVKELVAITGKSKSHISQLMRRGILPPGRKDGRYTYLPKVESILILRSHVSNKLWKPRKRKNVAEGPVSVANGVLAPVSAQDRLREACEMRPLPEGPLYPRISGPLAQIEPRIQATLASPDWSKLL